VTFELLADRGGGLGAVDAARRPGQPREGVLEPRRELRDRRGRIERQDVMLTTGVPGGRAPGSKRRSTISLPIRRTESG
jgi:hypothetical protein